MNDRPNRIEVVVDALKYRGYPDDSTHFSHFLINELRQAGIPMGAGPMIRITEGTLTRVMDPESQPGEMLFVWTAE